MPRRPWCRRRCGSDDVRESTAGRCTPITTSTEYEGRWYVSMSAGVTGARRLCRGDRHPSGASSESASRAATSARIVAAMGRSAVTRPWPTHGLAGLSQSGPVFPPSRLTMPTISAPPECDWPSPSWRSRCARLSAENLQHSSGLGSIARMDRRTVFRRRASSRTARS